MKVAQFLDGLFRQASDAGHTAASIAKKAGFPHPNILSNLRAGTSKVPVLRIPSLAKALGSDPRVLLELVMTEYQPEIWAVLLENVPFPLTEAELSMIQKTRQEALAPVAAANP